MKKIFIALLVFIVHLQLQAQNYCSANYYKLPDSSLTATFMAPVHTIQNGVDYSYTWDFGDGQVITHSKGQNIVTHSYATAGWYMVSLNIDIKDCRGNTLCSSSFSENIPAGLVFNPNSWEVKISVPDTLEEFQIHAYDSSDTHISNSPLITEHAFYELRSHFSPMQLGPQTAHHGGNGAGWGLRHAGVNKVCFYKKFYDPVTKQLVNEAYDCKDVIVMPPHSTSVSLSYSYSSGKPEEINFSSTYNCVPAIDSTSEKIVLSWNFGDESYGNGASVSHSYSNAGKYVVTLVIQVINKNTNQLVGYSTAKDTVEIMTNQYCSADFTYNTQIQKFSSTGTHYYSPDSTTSRYEWHFEDGTVSNDLSPTHTLTQLANVITMIQIIEDVQYNVVCSDTITKVIYMNTGVSCFPYFTFDSAQSGNNNVVIQNISLPQPADSKYQSIDYWWDFGDGFTSNLPFPTHVYQSSGPFELCLSVTTLDLNNQFCTDTICRTIGIDSLGNPLYKHSGFTLNIVGPNGTVDIREFEKSPVKIYPNPSTGIINVEGLKESSSWKLFSLEGRLIADGIANQNSSKIDFTNLKRGVYILSFESATNFTSIKVMLR